MVDMMKNLSPEQMAQMASVASTGVNGTSAVPPAYPPSQAAPPIDPSTAAELMKNLGPDQISKMADVMKGSGNIPAGLNTDPETIQRMVDLFKDMPAKDFAEMHKFAVENSAEGGPDPLKAGAGAMPPPSLMKPAMEMMRSMNPDDLAKMLKAGNPNMSEAQARQAAEQMRKMDDRVMGLILGLFSAFSGAQSGIKAAKEYLLLRPWLLLATVVLVVALVVRLAGLM